MSDLERVRMQNVVSILHFGGDRGDVVQMRWRPDRKHTLKFILWAGGDDKLPIGPAGVVATVILPIMKKITGKGFKRVRSSSPDVTVWYREDCVSEIKESDRLG